LNIRKSIAATLILVPVAITLAVIAAYYIGGIIRSGLP
jgi:hypothetical protein